RDQGSDEPGKEHRHAQGKLDARGDEAADAEHRGVAEADLAEIPAEPVPGERGGDPDEGEREQVVDVDGGVEDGHQRQHHARGEEPDRRPGPHPGGEPAFHPSTRWPNRPPGRITSTRTSRTNPTAAVRYAGMTRIANTSTVARISAAMAVPATLPSPPSTTTTNDLSNSAAPKLGVKGKNMAPSSPAAAASAVPRPKVSA